MSTPLLDIPMASQFYEDNGVELLVNGSFESGGTPPTGWAVSNAAMTTESGARTGGSGSYFGRVIPSVGYGYGGQAGRTVAGRRCHAVGWVRVEATQEGYVTNNGGSALRTLTSTSWTLAEYVGDVGTGILVMGKTAGKYVDADDFSLQEQFLYTRNRGLLGQTPATSRIQLGDGRTAASFPTMANLNTTPRQGFSFDGGDYVLWPNALATGTFTFCALMTRLSAAGNILDARAGGGTGFLWYSGAALAASSGTIYTDLGASTVMNLGPLTFVAVSGITLSAPSYLVVGNNNAFSGGWTGGMYGAQLHPGTLSLRQVMDVRQRMLSEVWR